MPGKSFRDQRLRAGIRANLAWNLNWICHEECWIFAEISPKTKSPGPVLKPSVMQASGVGSNCLASCFSGRKITMLFLEGLLAVWDKEKIIVLVCPGSLIISNRNRINFFYIICLQWWIWISPHIVITSSLHIGQIADIPIWGLILW